MNRRCNSKKLIAHPLVTLQHAADVRKWKDIHRRMEQRVQDWDDAGKIEMLAQDTERAMLSNRAHGKENHLSSTLDSSHQQQFQLCEIAR